MRPPAPSTLPTTIFTFHWANAKVLVRYHWSFIWVLRANLTKPISHNSAPPAHDPTQSNGPPHLFLPSLERSRIRRHHRVRRRFIPGLEIIRHLFHRDPLHPLMLVDMLDEPLVHQQHVGSARDVRVDGHGEDELVVLAVEVIEVVLIVINSQSASGRA